MRLYRPVGQAELDLIARTNYKEYPPRLPEQPIFYPVLNEKYAREIAEKWNKKSADSGYAGYVTTFEIENTYISQFDIQTVGASYHQEFWIPAEDLAELDGFKDKKISNILTAIAGSKTPTLDAFIYAIGVEGVGRVAAKDLAARFKSVENIKNATEEELIAMENVGEITAKAIRAYFADENNLTELDALAQAGVAPTWSDEKKEGIFSGQSVVLTGTLSSFKRSEAQKLIEERGGVCQSSVTAKTTLVLAGEEAGSKLAKAQKLGIKIIDETQFKQMLEE